MGLALSRCPAITRFACVGNGWKAGYESAGGFESVGVGRGLKMPGNLLFVTPSCHYRFLLQKNPGPAMRAPERTINA
jgi:hypothetical protein